MASLTYVVRRLALAAPLLLGMSLLVFGLMGGMIVDRLPVTIELTLLAALAAALIGVPLGLLAGSRRGGAADRASLALGLLGISLPDFWLGIMLILVLSLAAGVLPSSGFVPFAAAPLENLWCLALPALTLASSR